MSDFEKKSLILTVGLPRSGKTTWARTQNVPIVNPDSIRLALHGQRFVGLAEPFVWAIAKTMVRALFLAGHSTVILDACNVSSKRRVDWLCHEWDNTFVFMKADKEECIRRADESGDVDIIPVIERMAAEFEEISRDEMACVMAMSKIRELENEKAENEKANTV